LFIHARLKTQVLGTYTQAFYSSVSDKQKF
jgi:hypothetical protein